MKKTLKMMLVLLVGITAMGTFTSCTKDDPDAQYSYKYFDVENLSYYVEQETTALAFVAALNDVMYSFDGTNFTDSDIIAATQEVVNDYNNDAIWGTFYLKKCKVGDDNWKTIKTFRMTRGYKANSSTEIGEGCASECHSAL